MKKKKSKKQSEVGKKAWDAKSPAEKKKILERLKPFQFKKTK